MGKDGDCRNFCRGQFADSYTSAMYSLFINLKNYTYQGSCHMQEDEKIKLIELRAKARTVMDDATVKKAEDAAWSKFIEYKKTQYESFKARWQVRN